MSTPEIEQLMADPRALMERLRTYPLPSLLIESIQAALNERDRGAEVQDRLAQNILHSKEI